MDWKYFNALTPSDTKSEVYVAPKRPDLPYRPMEYTGPTFAGSTPVTGYGVLSSYMYELELGTVSSLVNGVTTKTRVYKYKNFGVMGTSLASGNAVRENPPAEGKCKAAYMSITIYPAPGYS